MTVTAFLVAATVGERLVVEAALDADPDLAYAASAEGVSALLLALYQGRPEIAGTIAARRPDGLTLFEAAALGDLLRLQALLDSRQARVEDLSSDGFTALHLAAFFGRFLAVKALLERRAPVDAVSQNAMRVTPLHSAVAHRDERTAQAIAASLLRAGADPNARQAEGFTPLQAAIANRQASVEKLLRAAGALD